MPLMDPDSKEQYLHFVPRKDVAEVTDVLAEFYMKYRSKEEEETWWNGIFLEKG